MKIKHILKSRDFAKVLEQGVRIKGNWISLYLLTEDAGFLRVGVIIPKKLARLAVQRNYLKRRIYAVFREKAQDQGAAGTMAVIRLVKEISSKKRKQFSSDLIPELEGLLNKAGIAK